MFQRYERKEGNLMEDRFKLFTVLIHRISRNISKIKSDEMSKLNLKSVHVSCLYYLYQKNGITAKELCDICDEDKAAISRSIEDLEKQKLILCYSKTEKRYKSPLVLTEEGTKIAKIVEEKIDGFIQFISKDITEEHREILYDSLHKIDHNLKKIVEEIE